MRSRALSVVGALVLTLALGYGFMFLGDWVRMSDTAVDVAQAEQQAKDLVLSYLRYMERDEIERAIALHMAPVTRDVYLEQYRILVEAGARDVLLSKAINVHDLSVVRTVLDEGYIVVRTTYDINSRYATRRYDTRRVENYLVGFYADEGWKIVSIDDLCDLNPGMCIL